MKLAIIGTGYVGLVSGVCLAELGHEVICIDNNEEKVNQIIKGDIPFYEPGLKEKTERNIKKNCLKISTDFKDAVIQSDIIFSAVGTPEKADGQADLMAIFQVVDALIEVVLSESLTDKIYVTKSTVPVGTGQQIIEKMRQKGIEDHQVSVLSNPEFLREGSAIHNFFHPDRIVIGGSSPKTIDQLEKVYEAIYRNKKPIFKTSLKTAELAKYAANAFLATKISFVNEMAKLSEEFGADTQVITQIMGKDPRIGPYFLHPGPGYGGSCLPKDTQAILHTAKAQGQDLHVIKAAIKVNEDQKCRAFDVLKTMLGDLSGKTVAVLGLAFKQDTDDIRQSATIMLMDQCLAENVHVRLYDPEALEKGRERWGEKLYYASDAYDAVQTTEAVILMTEWTMFRDLDLQKVKESMKNNIFIDLRNLYKQEDLSEKGFDSYILGKGFSQPEIKMKLKKMFKISQERE